ncbi:MAG: copper-translocating P-type ATPase [Oscillatoriophycideae cyanobacterium NC_groundwater_1537_Pr4_S-0.65um_50_18]|nr:copper-translocating P-type ATPase [Oscillatoriophycideae cyanobacterium NC_groundwater_1537_Pr4_S-0.65um_50_18]
MQVIPNPIIANEIDPTPDNLAPDISAPPATDAPALETITLSVQGMKCAGCVRTVENRLMQQPGVVAATVNFVTEVAIADCEVGQADAALLAQKLTEAGFPSQPRLLPGEAGWETAGLEGNTPVDRQRQETQQQIRRTAIALSLLTLSAIGHLVHFGWLNLPGLGNIWFHWGLATLALLFPGRSIIVDGWQGLRRSAPNMNTLVGMGTLTAYVTSSIALLFPHLGWECFFDEPVMLVGFILLGRTLEQQARSKATHAFQSLLALQPTIAHLIREEGNLSPTETIASAIAIPASQVKVGERLRVLPGEKIPVDGEICSGQTTLDESMLTGEATPVLRQVGEGVSAGSLNLSGAIALKATRTGKDTTLAQIIALVETAQTRKAPIQGLADQVAGYFTYGVMAIASLTFVFWYFIGLPLWGDQIWGKLGGAVMGGAMHEHMAENMAALPPSPLLLSLKLAIAILVIACPCALGLATPTAILVGSGLGAERGLLIRGGDVLENVHRLQTIVFDKTGTLTMGQPEVTDCIALQEGRSDLDLLQFAASVESGAQHPLSNAIQNYAQSLKLALRSATDFHTEPGFGVAAQVEGQPVVLGNADWLGQQGIAIKGIPAVLEAAGKTLVYIGISGQLAGVIAVQDKLRPEAQKTLHDLRQMGLRVMLLTGDRPEAAAAIAQSLGLSPQDIRANIRPEGKSRAIAELQAAGQSVAMVGDGINDAPALAQADVGISLHSGTDVAIEAADIVLMRDRLSAVVEAIHLSQATFSKIRQNLFWAFAYNILGIPAAAGLLLPTLGIALSPATAGAFMAFSSVSVVTNSLLLRRTFATAAKPSAMPIQDHK